MQFSARLTRALLLLLLFHLLFLSLPPHTSAQRGESKKKGPPSQLPLGPAKSKPKWPTKPPTEEARIDANEEAGGYSKAKRAKPSPSRSPAQDPPPSIGKKKAPTRGDDEVDGGRGGGRADVEKLLSLVTGPTKAAKKTGGGAGGGGGGGGGGKSKGSDGWLKDIPAEVQQAYLLNIGLGKGLSDVMEDDVVASAFVVRTEDDGEDDAGGNEIHELEDFFIWRKPGEGETAKTQRSITSATRHQHTTPRRHSAHHITSHHTSPPKASIS